MTFRYTQLPVFIEKTAYDEAIGRMASNLLASGKVKSIYQVGGVTSPGISDIDLYVVFNKNESWDKNPINGLPYPDNYLFTHRLFGCTEDRVANLEKFTIFGKYNLIAGTETDFTTGVLSESDTNILKKQIAIEYLIKAWIIIATEIYFKEIKVRSFLLVVKALLYDLEFLGSDYPELRKCISNIMEIRKNWFDSPIPNSDLDKIIVEYKIQLENVINSVAAEFFYLPERANMKISRRITITRNSKISLEMTPGSLLNYIPIPSAIIKRFTNFKVAVPVNQGAIPEIIEKRFETLREAFAYNARHLNGFMCTGHAMNIFY
jgi:hypothetical protein